MNKLYIGFDFSLIKPAATILHDNNFYFHAWPENISKKSEDILKNANVNVVNRSKYIYEKDSISDIMRMNILRSINLSSVICDSLRTYFKYYKNTNIFISQEGLSYGSSGASMLELAGYKYILMYDLLKEGIPVENMYTYSPATVKVTAKCSKKNESGKEFVINSFKNENINNKFYNILTNEPEKLIKKKNFVECVDDIVDSYFVLKTMLEKNNF